MRKSIPLFVMLIRTVTDAIVGKSLGDVWGHETFKNAIKSNIDLCLSGETVKYEASFNTPQFR